MINYPLSYGANVPWLANYAWGKSHDQLLIDQSDAIQESVLHSPVNSI